MSGIVCAECGMPLFHVNEACPNCLAGTGLVERPPTRCTVESVEIDGITQTIHDLQNRRDELEKQVQRLRAENAALKAEVERLRGALDTAGAILLEKQNLAPRLFSGEEDVFITRWASGAYDRLGETMKDQPDA